MLRCCVKFTRAFIMVAGLLYGANNLANVVEVTFNVTDVPGHWYDTGSDIPGVPGTRSLAIIAPGDTVIFKQVVESRHTITSLIWPSTAGANEKIDQDIANMDDQQVTLSTPGLYVFVCKLHPYMLGAVIVDKNANDGALTSVRNSRY